jgi:phosphopantothenoylcysteine decarboxylase/phosphopantothenate--cysteine ligase
MSRFRGRRFCVGVAGSIAAYRSVDFVKELVAEGADVRVVLTRSAREFVTPKPLETFTGHAVLSPDPFEPGHEGTDHIATARWADAFLVFGATADLLARLAQGRGDDFLLLQLLAFQGPVVIAPAMNPAMWENAAVQANVKRLGDRGFVFAGPVPGRVACGEEGVGHLAAHAEIRDVLAKASVRRGPLAGRRLLISAGPMRTQLDPVRFVQNESSGLMGLELARAARRLGADVRVLLGPVEAERAREFESFPLTRYVTGEDYGRELDRLFPDCDVFLSAAAVLDFQALTAGKKWEREKLAAGKLEVEIRTVPDFVARAAAAKRADQRVIAFALETGTDAEILARADGKRQKKKVDALVANPMREGLGANAPRNEVWILREGREPERLGPAPKAALAEPLLLSLLA